MANDLNQCNFIGRLGRDPESRVMPDGKSVVNFSIAVGWKTQNGEGAEWVNCVAYEKLAEIIAQYLKKGSQVFISGRFKTRKWQDKTTGADRYSTEIVCDRMQMLGGKADGGGSSSSVDNHPALRDNPHAQQSRKTDDFDEELDIPF